ncbi:hypothetical protein BGV40_09725 [Methanosarcina sp. Ant1]|nr:hypothetical protein BGV40_09725 [Methanosarcina sp. Ant1]
MAGLARHDPFIEINIIKNPDEFFGRKDELRTIFTRLQGLQSTSIYGERKIGKSSLLYKVFCDIPEELGNEYKSAYIDLRDSDYHTVYYFLKNVLSEFKCDPEVILENNTYNKNLIAFSESIKELSTKYKPVLLIDEFDHIIKKPEEFNKDFLDTLRTLGNHGHIAYITASLYSLKELCIKSKLNSPFYSIFYELQLGELTRGEITDFLSAKRKDVNFNAEEIKLIKEIAGNNPLHLRIACYHIFANKGKKWNRSKLKGKIQNEINHFDDKEARRKKNIRDIGKKVTKYISKLVENYTGN